MSGFWTIYRRELAGLFLSPLAWALLCLALLVNGVLFAQVYMPLLQGDIDLALAYTFGRGMPFWLLLVVLPPLLTMRMISEEARSGVLEFLLTAPVADFAVVLGKLAAATTLMALLWSSAFVYAFASQALGTPPDWPPVVSLFLGATLVSALFCALGLAMSAATNTPLLAAFLSVVATSALLMLQMLDVVLPFPPGHWVRVTLGHMKIATQFEGSFGRGLLDSKHIVQYGAWTGFFAFLATRLLETRRWR